MALEVRSLPPRLCLCAGLLLLPAAQSPAPAQEEPAIEENQDLVEAKARLLQELDAQLERRRAEIAREEESLVALEQALEAAKQALVEERQRLQELKSRVEADIARREQLVDERLEQIAKVYGAMKAKEAAVAIQGMQDDMAVAILERLPGRTVGKIFDLMPKERVRELTRRLEQGVSPETR